MYTDPIYQPLRSGRIWHKVNFKAEFDRFEFTTNNKWKLFCSEDLLENILQYQFIKNHFTHIYPTPPLGQDMTKGQFLSGLSYYLPIAGGRIIRFIPFSLVLVPCEMQSVSSRIWTRVTVFISYDDNHYTTDTSDICTLIILSWFIGEEVSWRNG